jgi:hypothetical protein
MIGGGRDASATFRNRCRIENAKTPRTQRATQNDSFAASLRSLRLCVFKLDSVSDLESK